MKIAVVKVGKVALKPTQELVDEYIKRIGRYASPESLILRNSGEKYEVATVEKLTRLCKSDGIKIALDERGRELSSPDLAKKLDNWINRENQGAITFFIGGPFGFPSGFLDSVDFVWSLSKSTFPSDLAWVLTWEQIYRSFAINHRVSYHHG